MAAAAVAAGVAEAAAAAGSASKALAIMTDASNVSSFKTAPKWRRNGEVEGEAGL